MKRLRICYAVKLRSGGLWGSDKRGLGPVLKTSECVHPGGMSVPCVPATYVKGLIRSALEEVWSNLVRLGIVGKITMESLLGPLTPFGGSASATPCNTIVGPLYPVSSLSDVRRLAEAGSLKYVFLGEALRAPELYEEPHVRIDRASGRVATGALFTEIRVNPSTLLYGEVIHWTDDDGKLVEAARALLVAISMMRYRYIGRKTSADVALACLEPSELTSDGVVSQIYSRLGLSRWEQ